MQEVGHRDPRRNASGGVLSASDMPLHGEAVRLFQRRIDGAEVGVQGRAEAIDRRDDRERNAGRDQTIFNRGRPRLIRKEFPQNALQRRLRVMRICAPVLAHPEIYGRRSKVV